MRDPKAKRARKLARRAQGFYLMSALGKAEEAGMPGALERALDVLTAPDGANEGKKPALQPAAITASRLPTLALGALAVEPLKGSKGGRLPESYQSALAALDGVAAGGGTYNATQARALLLRAHLRRVAVAPCLHAEMTSLLADVLTVLEAFFQAALTLQALPFAQGVVPVLQLTQQLTQGLNFGDATVLQAPHMTAARAASLAEMESKGSAGKGEKIKQGKGEEGGKGGGTADGLRLGALLSMPSDRRGERLKAAGFEPSEAADVEAFASVFPRASLDVRVEVQGEEDDEDEDEAGNGAGGGLVLVGDVVTVRVTLTLAPRGGKGGRAHLPAGCHAPLLPQSKPEAWVVALTSTNGGALMGLKLAPPLETWKVDGKTGARSWMALLQLAADAAGERRLEARALCSAYGDADVLRDVRFEVREMSPKQEKKLAAKAAKAAKAPPKPMGRGAGLMARIDGEGSEAAASDEDGSSDEEEDPLAGVDAPTRRAILQAQMEGLKCCGDC